MRRFKISVDGVAYDVTVEELEPDGKVAASADTAIGDMPPKAAAPIAPAPAKAVSSTPAQAGDVVSPLAGTVLGIKVHAGQAVKCGDPLLILEAMKMESTVVAPSDGTVQSISVNNGDAVQEGQPLLSLG